MTSEPALIVNKLRAVNLSLVQTVVELQDVDRLLNVYSVEVRNKSITDVAGKARSDIDNVRSDIDRIVDVLRRMPDTASALEVVRDLTATISVIVGEMAAKDSRHLTMAWLSSVIWMLEAHLKPALEYLALQDTL